MRHYMHNINSKVHKIQSAVLSIYKILKYFIDKFGERQLYYFLI